MQTEDSAIHHPDFIANCKWHADPISDNIVAKIIGTWNEKYPEDNFQQWKNFKSAIHSFPENLRNEQLPQWKKHQSSASNDISTIVDQYINDVGKLPDWANAEKIEIASDIFMKNGALSSVILFCSSLPECYHYPSISTLLKSSGNLEHQTAYRIRSTATMVFPVMLRGGLTMGEGSGILPVVKSRFTHAMIRNLALRGNPTDRLQIDERGNILPKSSLVKKIEQGSMKKDPFQSTFFNGWDLGRFGIPCNQEEQAYVLLCFSHVFLRGMQKMGVKLDSHQEEAFLHTWNVIGHVLGIDSRLMTTTQSEAGQLLTRIQSQSLLTQAGNAAQPALTDALIATMEEALPWTILKPLPTLMVQHLKYSFPNTIKRQHHKNIKNRFIRPLFNIALSVTTRLDKISEALNIRFSIMQATIHILGRRFVVEILKINPDTLHQKITNR